MPDNGYVEDEHDLRVNSDTEPEEVLDFLETRTKNPIVIQDTTVFNYGTHRIDEQRLRERIPSLFRDSYVIPFQLGPVWAFMLYHLPPEVRTLEYLIYDTDDGQYHPHRNFMRLADTDNVDAVEEDLSEWIQQNTDFNDEFQFTAQASGLDAYL